MGCGVGAQSTLHKWSSRGKQRVLADSLSLWEGSQGLLSLWGPSSVGGGIYSRWFWPRSGSRGGKA